MKKALTLFLLSFFTILSAQNIPDNRKVDWSICGYEGDIPCKTVLRNAVTEFGINNTGNVDVTTAVNNALIAIKDGEVLYFPAGTYLFNATVNVPAKRVIRGASATQTIFNFNFTSDKTCIKIAGSGASGADKIITAISSFGQYTVTVDNTSGLAVGDNIELEQANDPAIHGAESASDLTTWAENLKGQIAKIKAINGNVITLDRSLVFQYDINFAMKLRKLNMIEQVGLENFKLVRLSNNGIGNDNNNIWFTYANNCWMRRVHSEYSSRYHIRIDFSRNIEVSEIFMDKAYDCGGGGAGYGLLVQDHVTECLFENNIARSLRHPWIPKEGAARNVYAYNFSSGTTQGTTCSADPLTDSYADISLHGHYPAYNLFEGNIVYRIASSDAWGPNGPGNTFLRNRVLGQKGIWIQSFSKTQNVMGNEFTYPSAQFEMDRDKTVTGTTLNYSNYGLAGLLDVAAPNAVENSMYRTTKPECFGTMVWPSIGPGVSFNTGQIPAQVRFISGVFFGTNALCSACSVPNLGADKSLCGQTSMVLNSGLNATNRSFQWLRNGQDLNKSTNTINLTQGGTYVVKVDSAGCKTEDEIIISTVLSMPNLGADITLCNPSVANLSSNVTGVNFTYVWKRDGVIITNEAKSTFSTSKKATYRLEISASGCASVFDEIIVNSNLLDVKDDTLCEVGNANLSVLNNGNFNWFDQASGGTKLKSGKAVQFAVTSSKTYYVEDAGGISSLLGMTKPTLTNNMALKDDRFDRKMKFTVLSKVNIDSISIWSNTATAVTVRILISDNVTEAFTKTYSGIQLEKETRLFVGKELLPGDYFIDFLGTNGKLYYSSENDLTVVYPYTVANLISITGADPAWVTAKPYYMFAYNWRVTAGNTCSRTPVQAIVKNCGVTAISEINQLDAVSVYPNPFANGFTIQTDQSLKVVIYDLTGKLISEFETSTTQQYGQELSKGTYIVELLGTQSTKVFKIQKD